MFWIIVALALNSMVQPYGRVLDFPSNHAMLLRSSPVICVVDCACIIFDVVSWWVAMRGRWTLRQVAQMAIRRRFREVSTDAVRDAAADYRSEGDMGEMEGMIRSRRASHSTVSTTSTTNLKALQEHPWIRLFLFVFGTLPQAVKLYGLHGTPWSKALGAMYLGPLLLLELVIMLAGGTDTTSWSLQLTNLTSITEKASPLSEHINMSSLAIAVQVHMWTWALGFVIPDMPYTESWIFVLWFIGAMCGVLIYSFLLVFVLPVALLIAIGQCLPSRLVASLPTSVGVILCGLGYITLTIVLCIIPPVLLAHSPETLVGFTTVTILVVMGAIFIWALNIFSPFLLQKLGLRRSTPFLSSAPWLAIFIFCMNLGTAIIYYTHGWEPHGTVKPSWTEALG